MKIYVININYEVISTKNWQEQVAKLAIETGTACSLITKGACNVGYDTVNAIGTKRTNR